jgi:hypothetical protein
MSFDIRWDLLDDSEASRLKDLINLKFETSERPDFLGKLKVLQSLVVLPSDNSP